MSLSRDLTYFQRQLAVIKGQAWNIVQSLKHDVRFHFFAMVFACLLIDFP